MPVPPDYRIIFNWDGAPHGCSPTPQALTSFLDNAYAPLEDTGRRPVLEYGRAGVALAQRDSRVYR